MKLAAPRRAESRRDELLDRAEALFTAHGFHGVTLAAIAAAGGLGNAGLIHYFPTKQKLYREVLRRLGDDLDADVADALTAASGPREQLATLVRAVAAWSLQRAGRARLVIRELLDDGGAARIERARTLPLARFIGRATALVEVAQRARLVRTGDPLVVLMQIFGTLAYAQLARPTLARLGGSKHAGDEHRWMGAVVADVERTLFREV